MENDQIEKHRRECEARDVLKRMNIEQRREYLSGVEKKRGQQARIDLEQEILQQWKISKKP